MEEYPLIQTPEELEGLAAKLRRERAIAVDTEADSFFHYFDKLCLLQIGTRSGIHLIDPLALPEKGLAPLEPILADPDIRKVFHAAEYDLFVLHRHGGIEVRSLFDTMISAQLLGYPAVGLAALVERHFQVQLSKDQQRTDWSRRPLRSAQIAYAASDVMYLLELASRLERELRHKRRLDWAREEFRSLEERRWPEREFDRDGYLRIKGARKLSPRGLAVLRELYLMRDRRAREMDRPPFKVLGNGTLLDLAQKPPASRRALAGRRGVTELVQRRLGASILEAVARGLETPLPKAPQRKASNAGRRRLDRRGEQRLERLRRWRERRAADMDLDPGVFCPNAALEEIAAALPVDEAALASLAQVKGWWAREFAKEVLDTLQEPASENAAEPGGAEDPAPPSPTRSRSRRRRGRRTGGSAGG